MNATFGTPEVERNVILTMTEMEARHLAYIFSQVSALRDGFSARGVYSAGTIQNVLEHADKVVFMIRSLALHGDLGEGIRV